MSLEVLSVDVVSGSWVAEVEEISVVSLVAGDSDFVLESEADLDDSAGSLVDEVLVFSSDSDVDSDV